MAREKIKSNDYKIESNIWKYIRMLEEKREHNYEYHSDELEESLLSKGYEFYKFNNSDIVTMSELVAIEVVNKFRHNGYYARIIVGVEQNMQRIKMFSVVYKHKGK